MGRKPKYKPTARDVQQAQLALNRLRPLYDFMFQDKGNFEWYVSPGGYSFIKIGEAKQEKEQAA